MSVEADFDLARTHVLALVTARLTRDVVMQSIALQDIRDLDDDARMNVVALLANLAASCFTVLSDHAGEDVMERWRSYALNLNGAHPGPQA